MRGSVLAAWRKDLGWSQERLANALGVERELVEDLEHSPDISLLLEKVIASLRSTLAELKGSQPAPKGRKKKAA